MAGIIFSESSGVNDSIFGKSQAPIKFAIEKKAEAFEQESIVKQIFNMEKSDHYGEKITSLTAMNGFKPTPENGNYPKDTMQEGFSKFVEHVEWKDSFSISKAMIQDSKLLDLRKRPEAFVTGFYRTREQYGAAMLGSAIKGETKLNFLGKNFDVTAADNLPLFSKAHPSVLSDVKTKQSNQFSDVFSADALGAAESAMQDFRGDNNEVLGVTPDTIVIPNDYQLKKEVFAAIGADKDPNTANNGFNYLFGRWNIIVWQYLNQFIATGSKPWMLMSSKYNEEHIGAIWYDRTDLDIYSYIDNDNGANTWNGDARYVAAFNDWRAFAIGGVTGGTTLIS